MPQKYIYIYPRNGERLNGLYFCCITLDLSHFHTHHDIETVQISKEKSSPFLRRLTAALKLRCADPSAKQTGRFLIIRY